VHRIVVPAEVSMVSLLGARDEILRAVERSFSRADIHVRGNEITVTGPFGEVALVERLVDELIAVLAAGQPLSVDAVERSVGMLRQQTSERPADVLTLNILSNRGRTIRPKTLNQKRYVDAIDQHTVVFGIGPAGTGKTYLAMAKAVQSLQAKRVNRIILTRPAVEAGERLGFLPGTLTEKIDPYLRPLYDALHDMIDPESIPACSRHDRGRRWLTCAAARSPATPRFSPRRASGRSAPSVVTVIGQRPANACAGCLPAGPQGGLRVTTRDGASTLAAGSTCGR
jgi:phosphate starvation-inducible PhoH-like protein